MLRTREANGAAAPNVVAMASASTEQRSDNSRVLRVVGLAWAFALAVMVATQIAATVLDRSVAFLTREPQAALEGVWYAGATSNVGAVLWFAGAGACAVAWLALRDGYRSPFLHGAVLLTVLGADDLFLLHDVPYAKVVPEIVVLGFYFFLLAAFPVVHRHFLQAHGVLPFLPLSLALLVFSGVLDQYFPGHHIVEDGAKLLAVVTLVTALGLTAVQTLRAAVEARRPADYSGAP
jgi:hypothetical protein